MAEVRLQAVGVSSQTRKKTKVSNGNGHTNGQSNGSVNLFIHSTKNASSDAFRKSNMILTIMRSSAKENTPLTNEVRRIVNLYLLAKLFIPFNYTKCYQSGNPLCKSATL